MINVGLIVGHCGWMVVRMVRINCRMFVFIGRIFIFFLIIRIILGFLIVYIG